MIESVPQPLLTCEWLHNKQNCSDRQVILDATFFLPVDQRNAQAEFHANHIPGAQFFDIDAVADHATALPHMLPSPDEFADAVGKLGIDNNTLVIVYDNNRFMASARAWWMFRVFGHDHVLVLDGGLQRWQALGLPMDTEIVHPTPLTFQPAFRPELVYRLAQMRQLAEAQNQQLLDARSAGRFTGRDAEPRPGLKSGHIPGSRHLFFADLVDPETKLMRPLAEIAQQFKNAGIDPSQPVVTTCGTGVTAAILALGLYLLGQKEVAVYDGSWSEWGSLPDTPVSTGIG